MSPTFIKIDREILHFEKRLAKSIIKSLAELKYDFHTHIIIEGLDNESNISLKELIVELNVEYVQGHNLGKAGPEIVKRLDREKAQDIFKTLAWGFKEKEE